MSDRLILESEIKKREHDVVLKDGAKHRCFDTTMLFEIPTVDAVPIDWILNHEKMPKSGKGHDAIMDMIESWRERRKDATND